MQQLDPKAVWLFFLNSLLRTFILIFLLSGTISSMITGFSEETADQASSSAMSGWFIWFVILSLVLFLIQFLWAKLSYNLYRYELREDGFRKESGVIYKRYTSIPYERIQNVDIHRGILARLLGLSDLQIQTAGSSASYSSFSISGGASGAEGRLPGLSAQTAEMLRDELIKRSRDSKQAGV